MNIVVITGLAPVGLGLLVLTVLVGLRDYRRRHDFEPTMARTMPGTKVAPNNGIYAIAAIARQAINVKTPSRGSAPSLGPFIVEPADPAGQQGDRPWNRSRPSRSSSSPSPASPTSTASSARPVEEIN